MGMLFRYHNQNQKGVTAEVAPSPKVGKKSASAEKENAIDLDAMNGTKLRKLAKENGVENPEELTVGELRSVLREKLG